MRILIVGPQGAGKGNQAALLANNLHIPHISTGDVCRANVSRGCRPTDLDRQEPLSRPRISVASTATCVRRARPSLASTPET